MKFEITEHITRPSRHATRYLSCGAEEAPLIATRVKVDTFVNGVAELRDAVERLEKRIGKLG